MNNNEKKERKIKNTIKTLRKIKGFKQAKLAEKCNISVDTVGRWEQGSREEITLTYL